jgi:hypothetical protein
VIKMLAQITAVGLSVFALAEAISWIVEDLAPPVGRGVPPPVTYSPETRLKILVGQLHGLANELTDPRARVRVHDAADAIWAAVKTERRLPEGTPSE